MRQVFELTICPSDYNLSAQLNFSHHGPEYRNSDETGRSGYTATAAYLSLRKRILDFREYGHLDIRGEIRNLFDRYYESMNDCPSPGRSFFVSVAYTY
jgi:outer membrane cobalamin receptor